MLVGNGVILIQLSRQSDLSLATAITSLTQSALGVLVVLLFAIVLTTMVTQAFSLEVIRLPEGYWGATRIMSRAMIIRTKRQVRRRRKTEERFDMLNKAAFEKARDAMLKKNVPRERIDAAEDLLYHRTKDWPEEKFAMANSVQWKPYCPPELLRHAEELVSRIKEYPQIHRMLPTRLGNTLRSVEDPLTRRITGGLEGLIQRNYDQIPEKLQSQHDQYRARLDMYCILVFVFLLLAILGPLAIVRDIRSPWPGGTVFLLYCTLSWVSYEAAVASARGYGSVLRAVVERLGS